MSFTFLLTICLTLGFAMVYNVKLLGSQKKQTFSEITKGGDAEIIGFSMEYLLQIMNVFSLYLLTYTILSVGYWFIVSPVYYMVSPFLGPLWMNIIWLHSMMHVNVLTMYIVKKVTSYTLIQKILDLNNLQLVKKMELLEEMCKSSKYEFESSKYKHYYLMRKWTRVAFVSFISLLLNSSIIILCTSIPILGPLMLQIYLSNRFKRINLNSINNCVNAKKNSSNRINSITINYKQKRITSLFYNIGNILPYISIFSYLKEIVNLVNWTQKNGYLTKVNKICSKKKITKLNNKISKGSTIPFFHLCNDNYRQNLYKKL